MEDTNILNVTFWEYSDIQRPMKMEKGESSPCIKFTDFAGWSYQLQPLFFLSRDLGISMHQSAVRNEEGNLEIWKF